MQTRNKVLNGLVLLSACILAPHLASAVPSYTRQTGQSCSACHVGSFGPQLTTYGRDFKLNGYTEGGTQNPLKNFSVMAIGGYERTAKDLPPDSTPKKVNNNWTIDQISLFYSGALTPHIGMFAQGTYDGVADHYTWDNVDIRYANSTKLAGKDFIYGVTVNNNPSSQDLWQTSPAWRFPYVASGIAPTPDAGPYMATLGQTVGGVGLYSMWNNTLYTEISGYSSLPDRLQQNLGVTDAAHGDHLQGTAPYWRVALQHEVGHHYAELGTYGMFSQRYPGNDQSAGSDSFLDNAIDATYQYSVDRHAVAVYGSALNERQNLDSTVALGGASNQRDNLNCYTLNLSYYYNNTYGITLGHFITQGTADETLFPDASSHRPDSEGSTIQLDVTPFGKSEGLAKSYFNIRFFAKYVAYDKFNGQRKNYDGTGRNAYDKNTLFVGSCVSF